MTFGEHSIISPCPVHGLEFRVFPPLDRTPNKTRDPQSTLSIVWRSHGFTCAKMEVTGKNGHLIRLPSGMSVHRRLLRFFFPTCLLPPAAPHRLYYFSFFFPTYLIIPMWQFIPSWYPSFFVTKAMNTDLPPFNSWFAVNVPETNEFWTYFPTSCFIPTTSPPSY